MLPGLRLSLLRATARRPLALARGFRTAGAMRSGAPTVSAAMVKALRDRTGAGMMDCKAALIAAADASNEAERMTRAAEWLRKKGVSTAQKKSGRLAAQGLVGVTVDASGARAAAVEINSETDFVARNAQFQRLVSHITLSALAMPHTAADPATGLIPAAALSAAPLWNNPQRTVGDAVTDAVAAIKENLQIRRAARLHVQPNTVGAVFGYVHSPVDAPAEVDAAAASDPHELKAVQMGRIGSLVSLASRTPVPEPAKALAELGAGLTMHVVASAPAHLSRAAVPAEAVAKERELIRAAAVAEHAKKSAAAVAAGKPAIPEPKAAALDKMVDGKLKKWLTEQVLLEQTFISADAGAETVEKVLTAAGVDAKGFARFAVGEGLNPISAGTAAAN